jgi:hypothetical protein
MKKFMIIEKYKPGCFEAIYERYNLKGRMLPKGLHYLNSWVNKDNNICFQLMESNNPGLFSKWFSNWEDLIDFEIFPID